MLEFDKNEILIDALGGDLANPVWNYRADLCVPLPVLCGPLPDSLTLLRLYSDVSRTSNISVAAYLRTSASPGKEDMGNDMLLARVDLTPSLDGHVCIPFLVPKGYRHNNSAACIRPMVLSNRGFGLVPPQD